MRNSSILVTVTFALLGGVLFSSCGDDSTTGPSNGSTHLALRTQPSGAVLGVALNRQPVLEVLDAGGSLIATDNSTRVRATIGSGGGQLVGTVVVEAVGGVIRFTDLTIAGQVGDRTLSFVAEPGAPLPGLASVTSEAFPLQPGAPNAVISLNGDGQTGFVGEPLSDTLMVAVTDPGGDAAAGIDMEWSATTGAGSIQPLGAATDANGLSKAVWILGPRPTDYTASATVGNTSATTFTARAIYNPDAPLPLVASALTSSSEAPVAGVYVHGNLAFVGGASTGYFTTANIGVRIVDLSDPFHPVLVGRIPLRTRQYNGNHATGDAVVTRVESSAFQGEVALVLEGVPDGYHVVDWPQPYGVWDVSDPGAPVFLNAVQLGTHPLGNGSGGELGDKPHLSKEAAGNHFFALYQRGAVLASREQGLAIVDLSDPAEPVVAGEWKESSGAALLSMSINEEGTRAYLAGVWPAPYGNSATHGYLYVIDTQDPSQPTELGRFVFPLRGTISSMWSSAVSTDESLLVLADGSWAVSSGKPGILHILDISDPNSISEISTFALPESTDSTADDMSTDAVVRGSLMYSAWLSGGVRATDISDPTNPVQVGRFFSPQSDVPWISDVALLGTEYVIATSVWGGGIFVLARPEQIQP